MTDVCDVGEVRVAQRQTCRFNPNTGLTPPWGIALTPGSAI